MRVASLEQRMLAAHARNDSEALMALYGEAADLQEVQGDIDAACFYLTQAFVYALESGSGEAHALQTRLWKWRREIKPV